MIYTSLPIMVCDRYICKKKFKIFYASLPCVLEVLSCSSFYHLAQHAMVSLVKCLSVCLSHVNLYIFVANNYKAVKLICKPKWKGLACHTQKYHNVKPIWHTVMDVPL